MNLKAPLTVFLEVTASCNLQCTHCYVPNEKRAHELSTDEILDLIDYLSRNEVPAIAHTGGEPFCKKEITKILRFSIDCGLWTSIFTNGTLLKGTLLEEVSRMELDHLQITIFSHQSTFHDTMVQKPGAFDGD